MEYTFTDEQTQFRDIVARFCREKSPAPVVRRLIDSEHGFDPGMWQQICQELGLVGIHIPESKGGPGFSPVELGIVMEEFGRALVPAPYLSSAVLACSAVAEIGDASIRDPLLGALTTGDKTATLAVNPDDGNPVSPVAVTGAGRLNGAVKAVLGAASADVLLVIAYHQEEIALFSIDAGATGVDIKPLKTMDGTRRQARVGLHDVAAARLGELSTAQAQNIYDTALVALANEMVGGAQALLDAAVEYTKLRVQFGRAIGSFQAIKHRLADLLVDVELARAGAYQAAQALASDEEASVNASLAKFTAADTFMKAARECIQLHGGIGFTWENDTHLWYRRAKSSEVLLGTPAFHRERMLKEMGV